MNMIWWLITIFMICVVWIGTWYLGASQTESIIVVMVYVLGNIILHNQSIILEEIKNDRIRR